MPPLIVPATSSSIEMDQHPPPPAEEDEPGRWGGAGAFFKSSSTTRAAGQMFERRKRRQPKEKKSREEPSSRPPAVGGQVPKGVDPYESDPGESYREHCARHNRPLNCLSLPQFLLKNQLPSSGNKNNGLHHRDDRTESPDSSPPAMMPTSLPISATRVRYSLRSTITDGTDPQPSGTTSVLERRKLRPNDVKLNISHWSDEGGRPYMEDRYVRCCWLLSLFCLYGWMDCCWKSPVTILLLLLLLLLLDKNP
jgi:hypothetical protein